MGPFDGLQKLPEDRGGHMAQDGTVAAGEDRAHEAAVEAQAAVPHRVDAVVNTMELPALQAPRNRVLTNPNRMQLRNRDDSMLPSRKFRNRQIERVTLLPHVGE
jgi:hypothetical protein